MESFKEIFERVLNEKVNDKFQKVIDELDSLNIYHENKREEILIKGKATMNKESTLLIEGKPLMSIGKLKSKVTKDGSLVLKTENNFSVWIFKDSSSIKIKDKG